jgi:hypothetical protein
VLTKGFANEDDAPKLVAIGEASSQDFIFTLKVPTSISLSSEIHYLKIMPNRFQSIGRSRVSVEFRSPFAGNYLLKYIKAELLSPLSLFETTIKLDVQLSYKVYPKIHDIALATTKLLASSGIGEIPTEVPGIGTEFYDTREYQSGDDIHRVNWKATARLGELIVNEHAKEVGASYYLILESRVTNYFDLDRLASTFLQIANILFISGANFGVIVQDGIRVTSFKKMERPFDSLLFALNVALEYSRIEEQDPLLELTPIPSRIIRSTRDALSKEGFTLLSQIEDISQSQMQANILRDENDVATTILKIMKENSVEPPAIIHVGALRSPEISRLIELSDSVKRVYNSEFIVVDPTKPWVVALDESEGARLYENRMRILKIFSNSNVRYFVGDPLQISEKLFH